MIACISYYETVTRALFLFKVDIIPKLILPLQLDQTVHYTVSIFPTKRIQNIDLSKCIFLYVEAILCFPFK